MKPARPAIFLGIEGVISTADTDIADRVLSETARGRPVSGKAIETLFANDACANLRLLQAEFNAEFVVTSVWAEVLEKAELSKLLTQARLTFVVENLHRHWCSTFSEWSCRRDEIEDWLRLHGRPSKPQFVVIDAAATGQSLLNSPLLDRTVFCHQRRGFGLAELDRAQKILRA